MRIKISKRSLRILAVVVMTLVLSVSALGLLITRSTPVQADTGRDLTVVPGHQVQPPAKPLASHLSINLAAVTNASSNGSIVYNGDRITYTLTIAQNGPGEPVGNLQVVMLLPQPPLELPVFNSVDDVSCSPLANCEIGVITTPVPLRQGSVDVVKPYVITWTFASPSNFPLTLEFTGRVTCRPAGTDFTLQAALDYSGGFAFSNPIASAVQIAPPGQNGHFALSSAPDLCSQEGPIGGTSDMDWGDFDNDGDLDLALIAYERGVFVYRNNGGKFKLFWQDKNLRAEGVRWADFDRASDHYLELLISGAWSGFANTLPDNSTPGSYSFAGLNYLYKFNGTDAFTVYDTTGPQGSSFITQDGAWRAEVADFTGDDYPDIVMLNYWGGCTAELYENDKSGKFARNYPSSTKCLYSPPPAFTNYTGDGPYTHSAAWGDYDNNGTPDLAVGYGFRNFSTLTTTIRVYKNNPLGTLGDPNFVPVMTTLNSTNFKYVYDLAWGDYDGDGRLDLAAAFATDDVIPIDTLNGGVMVYRNVNDNLFTPVFAQTTKRGVGAVDWADFNGDGNLELIVAETDARAKIYAYNTSTGSFDSLPSLGTPGIGDTLAVRGVDYDNDGDIDVALTNSETESWLFTNAAPFLRTRLGPSFGSIVDATSVAWGDVNGGFPELLFGTTFPRKIFQLDAGLDSYLSLFDFAPNPPAQVAAFGNFNGDNALDLVLGQNGQNFIYLNLGTGLNPPFPATPSWFPQLSDNTSDLVVTDVDQDTPGKLDLIVGNRQQPNRLYMNQGTLPATNPTWKSDGANDTRSIAWGYFDNDILPDFAAANSGQPTIIYRNTGYNSFTVGQVLATSNARSVAWGDYDGDGDMDLMVGNYGQANQLYQNNGGHLSLVWADPPGLVFNTTSVAWGDWNNDGYLDLAVGNDGQADQVFGNLHSTPSQVNLVWLWKSEELRNTTDVAWGDYDGDGDLDLATSKVGGSQNGIYENVYNLAAHIGQPRASMLLPQNSSYLSIAQPGRPGQVFSRTAPLVISSNLTIPISFTLFDPDLTRQSCTGANGESIKVITYEYSLSGGSVWHPATVNPILNPIRASCAFSTPHTVTWQAGQDIEKNSPNQAVSDDARFRISISRDNIPTVRTFSPLQRGTIRAVSPPFRVRNTSCLWPEDPYVFSMQPSPPITIGTKVTLEGRVRQWDIHKTGITFTWNFGGNNILNGQIVDYTLQQGGSQVFTLTVAQAPCPNTRPDFITGTLTVKGSRVYLPIILKPAATGATSVITKPATSIPTPELELFALDNTPGSPAQVAGLVGRFQSGKIIELDWEPRPADEAIIGYRVYRAAAGGGAFYLLAEMSADETHYTDDTAACGLMYFVTAYNTTGESLPSTSSYFSTPCQ